MPNIFQYCLQSVLPTWFIPRSWHPTDDSDGDSTNSGGTITGNFNLNYRETLQPEEERILKYLILMQDRIAKDKDAPSTFRKLRKLWRKIPVPFLNMNGIIDPDVPANFSGIELNSQSSAQEIINFIRSILNDPVLFAYLNQLVINDARRHLLYSSTMLGVGLVSVWKFGTQNRDRASANLPLLTNGYSLPKVFEDFLAYVGNIANAYFYRATVSIILKKLEEYFKSFANYFQRNNYLPPTFITVTLLSFLVLAFFSAGGDFVMSNGLEGWSYALVLIFHFLSGFGGMFGYEQPFMDFLGRDKDKPFLTWKNFGKFIGTILLTAFIFCAFYPSALLAARSVIGEWLVWLTITIGLGNALLFSYDRIYGDNPLPSPFKDPVAFLIVLLTSAFFMLSGNNTYAAATMVLIEEVPAPTIAKVIRFCTLTATATGALNTLAAITEVQTDIENVATLTAGKSAVQRKLLRMYDSKVPTELNGVLQTKSKRCSDEENPLNGNGSSSSSQTYGTTGSASTPKKPVKPDSKTASCTIL